jgi:hypothetical protein
MSPTLDAFLPKNKEAGGFELSCGHDPPRPDPKDYDAMKRAFEKLSDGPGTKAVVIFAEGNDHGSSIGWKSLTRLAHRAQIACYVGKTSPFAGCVSQRQF